MPDCVRRHDRDDSSRMRKAGFFASCWTRHGVSGDNGERPSGRRLTKKIMHENRRSFLRLSAALAAGARGSAASDRANLGFIGLGLRGTLLRRLFQAMPDVNIVAGADLYDGHLETSR